MSDTLLKAKEVRVYVTHCSRKKNDLLRESGEEVTPDQLYTSRKTRAFMRRCLTQKVRWGIFSDYYGIWFYPERHAWYGDDVGDPSRVTEAKFQELLADFDTKLARFREICFYRHPTYFHPLYRRLLDESKLKARVKLISHVHEIVGGQRVREL